MKRLIITFSLMLAAMLAPLTAHAELPDGFWELNTPYAQAMEENNPWGVIYWGKEIVDFMESIPAGNGMTENERTEVIASRLLKICDSLEALGKYQESVEYHRRYIPYAEALDWADGVKIAKAKIDLYTPSVQLYTETTHEVVNYGAKFEPSFGAYYGRNWERSEDSESMEIVYMYFHDNDFEWLNGHMDEIHGKGKIVELALNCLNHGEDIRNVDQYMGNIKGMLDTVSKYPDQKVFLRIAAEQNIWDDLATPEEYIGAFRKIANLAHTYPNIATVFSVSHASSWDVNMEDYYPGDEYVDWVGISAYMIRHFQGVDQIAAGTEYNDICFTAGRAADPVAIVRETVEKFGDRKPIMIAEGGATNYCRPLGKDTTEWAKTHIRMMYNYLPMVYPQIKLIAYFDVSIQEEMNEYSIYDKPELLGVFEGVVSLPHFIQNGEQNAKRTWSQLGDYFWVSKSTPAPVSAYVHIFGTDEATVSYYIDGELAASSDVLPYRADIDFSRYQNGEHTLTVSAIADSGEFYRQEFKFDLQD